MNFSLITLLILFYSIIHLLINSAGIGIGTGVNAAGAAAGIIGSYLDDPINVLSSADNVASNGISDLILAYKLQNDKLQLTVNTELSATAKSNLFNRARDFIIATSPLTNDEVLSHPNLSQYPVFAQAMVPVYNLPSISPFSPRVTFDRDTIARIFYGNISKWNDPAIIATNPALIMPDLNITVIVQDEISARTTVWTDAMGKFNPLFISIVGVSSNPKWPKNFLRVSGIYGCSSKVLSIPGSISFSVLGIAQDVESTIGSIINRAGQRSIASAQSVDFALVELATQSLQNSNNQLNLNDASGGTAWPICIPSYLLIDREYSRTTCSARKLTIEFITWFYTAPVVATILSDQSIAAIPQSIMKQLNILYKLQTTTMCDNQIALGDGIILSDVNTVGSSRIGELGALINEYIDSTDMSATYLYQSAISSTAFLKAQRGEADLAWVYLEDVDTEPLALSKSRGDLMFIPAFLTNIVSIHNSLLAPGVLITKDQPLVLTMDTLAKLTVGYIPDWTHPDIAATNPWLAAKFAAAGVTNAPVTIIFGCSTAAAKNMISTSYARYMIGKNSPFMTATIAANPTVDSFCKAMQVYNWSSVYDFKGHRYIQAATDNQLDSIVGNTIGGIGYYQQSTLADQISNTILLIGRDGSIQKPDVPTLRQCAIAAWDESNELIDMNRPEAIRICWPGTQVVYAVSKSSYSGLECPVGNHTLWMLNYIQSNSGMDYTFEDRIMLKLSSIPNIAIPMIRKVNYVTCDGETILITLPIIWNQSSGTTVFGQIMSGLGIVICAIAFITVVVYRSKAVFRSASSAFVAMTIAGVAILFLSTIFLVAEPTDSMCSAWGWTLNLGYTITFAPLFAKTWRIYAIFGRNKLKVVKISNRKLGSWLCIGIGIELLLLILWQSISGGMRSITIDRIETGRLHQYNHCLVNSSGTPFIAILGTAKGLMLLFGALMAFSIRKVASAFNESSQLAWAIYNVIFSVIIVIPIIIFINAVGDVLVLLLTFLLLWISFVTLSILFVPKLLALFNKDAEVLYSEQSSHRTVSNGFSFASVLHMAAPILARYITAVKNHLAAAEKRYNDLSDNPLPAHTAAGAADKDSIGNHSMLGLSKSGGGNGNSALTLDSIGGEKSTGVGGINAGPSYRLLANNTITGSGAGAPGQKKSAIGTVTTAVGASSSAVKYIREPDISSGRKPAVGLTAKSSNSANRANSPSVVGPGYKFNQSASTSTSATAAASATATSTAITIETKAIVDEMKSTIDGELISPIRLTDPGRLNSDNNNNNNESIELIGSPLLGARAVSSSEGRDRTFKPSSHAHMITQFPISTPTATLTSNTNIDIPSVLTNNDINGSTIASPSPIPGTVNRADTDNSNITEITN